MAHKKAGGSTKNLRDSQPKYLGLKLGDGQVAKPGSIILRQRGTVYMPGRNVGIGKDHTLFALRDGKVAKPGSIILRQRGTVYMPGRNVGIGKDHTLFALRDGKVKFANKRKISFTGKSKISPIVSIV